MAGFTGTRYTAFNDPLTLTIAAPTFNVSTYVPNPAAATATVRAGLQAALDAVGAAGGTLTFDVPDTTYQINATLNLQNKARVRIVGGGCTIFHANGWNTAPSGSHMLNLTGSSNLRIEDITFDGNRAGNAASLGEFSSSNILVRQVQNSSFIRVMSNNAPSCDAFRLDSGTPASIASFPTNLLFYKCEAHAAFRLGFFVRCGRNIQVLGGEFSETLGTQPASGMDWEPEQVEAHPAIDQVLIRGVSFIDNSRTGVQTTSKGAPTRMTIEGCYFTGTTTTMPNPLTADRGSGLCIGFNDMVIQKNTFELFDTSYNPVTSVITLPNLAAPTPGTILILDNVFNDITQNQTCIRINASNSGGIQVTGNRAYDVAGSMNTPANSTPDGKAIFTNNIKTTGAPTYPSPMPPWDVTFAEDGSDPDPPGGAIEFDANSTSGSEHSADASWTHTPVGTPKGVVVLIVGRLGSAGQTDEVLGVTYGGVACTRAPLGFASDTLTETGSAYAYHLGMGIPTGAQTVAIDFVASPVGFYRAHCFTVTADGDTVVTASGVVEENQANPAISLVTPAGFECFVAGALFSGAATAGVAVGADYTEVADYEQAAARTMNFMRRTSDSTGGTVTADWVIAAADDVAGVAIAINSSGTVPVVNVLVQPTGFSRTRALGTLNVNVTDPPVVILQPLGLERTSLRVLGDVALAFPVVQEPPVDYTALTDEEMSALLVGSTDGPIDPHIVRNALLTLRDRGAQSQSGEIDNTFTLLEDFEFDLNLNDNTTGTVDPYFARSAVLTLADRLVNITQPSAPLDGTYRILTAAEMLAYMKDDTNGYVDPYVMRSAVLTLRDWLALVPV